MDGFRAFAQLIEAALGGKDAAFFVERARLTEVTCTGEEFEPVPCHENPVGTSLSGVLKRVWSSDFSEIVPPPEYAERLEGYFAAARGDLSDDYGSGSLTLYALAHGQQDGEDVFRAITTLIVDGPSGAAGETQRQVHVFDFVLEDGRWHFTGEIAAVTSVPSAATPVPSPEWLSGQCGDCYDQWERWGGAVPGTPAATPAPSARIGFGSDRGGSADV